MRGKDAQRFWQIMSCVYVAIGIPFISLGDSRAFVLLGVGYVVIGVVLALRYFDGKPGGKSHG